MNKFCLYLGAIGSLSILLVSCGSSDKPPAISVVPVSNPHGSTVKTSSPVTPQVTIIKDSSVVGSKTLTPSASTTGLISSTNGDAWAKTVSKGRIDPFAGLTLQPISVMDKVSTDVAVAPVEKTVAITKIGKRLTMPQDGFSRHSKKSIIVKQPMKVLVAGKKNYAIAISLPGIKFGVDKKLLMGKPSSIVVAKSIIGRSHSPAAFTPTKSVRPVMIPVVARISSPENNKKLPASIDRMAAVKSVLANTMEITGVIDVGGRSQVIVRLPNETLSRYVEVGDLIPDTFVRVDRVDVQADSTRVIVLEELGIKIFRKINDLQDNTIYKVPVASQENKYLFTEGFMSPADRLGQYIQVFDSNTMPITSQSLPDSMEKNASILSR